MSEAAATQLIEALGAYFASGVVVALAFLILGVAAKDKAAKGASLLFRPMIFLGCVGLWPYVLARWFAGPAINHPHEDDA